MADLENKLHHASHVEAPEKPSKALIENAAIGSQIEHELSAWEAIKAYPVAVFWCLMVSMCVVMVSVISSSCRCVKHCLTSCRKAMILFLLETSLHIRHLRKSMESLCLLQTATN